MHSRASGTPVRRARKRAKLSLTASLAVLALTASAVPAIAAQSTSASAQASRSAWEKGGHPAQPVFRIGTNKAPKSVPAARPTADEKAWAAHEEQRLAPGKDPAVALAAVPEGQGDVPWHQISNSRLTDAMVARVNYSNGNLMLASTDFDIAGVGQKLRMDSTYNSLEAPSGTPASRWMHNYQQHLDVTSGEVVLYDHSGASLRFKASGSTYTTPAGYSKDMAKVSDGYTVTDRKSGTKEYFNASGVLTKIVDKNAGTQTVAPRADGGFKVTDGRSGRWVEYSQVTELLKWQVKDSTGRTVVYNFDGYDNLRVITDAAGKQTDMSYDSSGRVWKIITPDGRETVFTYDGSNRVTSMQRRPDGGKSGPTWTFEYSEGDPAAAGTTTVKDPDQDATIYTHDSKGRVTEVEDPLHHKRSGTFDAQNNVVTAVDAMGEGSTPGNTTTYGWNSRNNPTSAEMPTGATASVSGYQTIAGSDLPGTFKTPDGQESSYKYDTKGNTTSVATTGTEGGQQDFGYNTSSPKCGGFEGQTCSVEDGENNKTSFAYDAQGNLSTVTPPAPMAATNYTYDALGRPLTVVNGNGVKQTFTYDNRDRVTKVEAVGAVAVSYVYDGDGNLKSRTDASGTLAFTYDGMSRETIRTLQNGAQTVLAYTASEGNVDYYTDPQGTTDYTYDKANHLIALKAPNNKTTTFENNANGNREKTTYPGGTVQAVDLDKSMRPQNIKTTSPKGTLVDLSYDYAYDSGTDGTKIRTKTDNASGVKTTYTYDSQGRMSYAKETKGSTDGQAWKYCYDKAGNLTSQGTTPGCPRGTTYNVNAASQITAKNNVTTGWSYDKAGNETAGAPLPEVARTAEQYTPFDQLKNITVAGTSYTATYGGTDSSERLSLGTTTFRNGPLGLTAQTTAGKDTGFVRDPKGTLDSMTTGGKSYYYLTDALGSVIGTVDEAGTKANTYDYNPRGETRATTNETAPQPYRYTGAYQDPTQLYKMGARYYDTNLGRFTQTDPSGQETNPYLYATGDPINHTDPTGLFGWSDFGENVGAFVGGVVAGAATAAVCSTVVGCVALGIGLGALGGASGGAIGSALSGGSPADRQDAFYGNALGGALGAIPTAGALRWLNW
ncbi:RHS repeat-associated core domain-containing protein [Streptomyces sp. NPDC090231]|uniref:RHS repeat-associated core domain-containing protein n=1 Tax=unclassified Streptomyces TaxID=2593676 RepID=UPI00380C1F81